MRRPSPRRVKPPAIYGATATSTNPAFLLPSPLAGILVERKMFVSVTLPDGQAPGASVPAKAVFLKGDKHCIFIEEQPGRFARQEVEIGAEQNGRVLIVAGARLGQRVVTDGCTLLQQMLKRVVSFALHQPLFVMLMVILFIGGGWVAFHNLPIEAFPDVSDLQVNVITLYPGRAPEEVEIVLMRKGENPSRVLAALKERIELLNRSVLPKGVKVVPYYDRTWLIDTTLHTVFKNLEEGAMLVTFVLLLFLGNFRAAAIVACIIPLSLLATFIGLTWRGLPANLLSRQQSHAHYPSGTVPCSLAAAAEALRADYQNDPDLTAFTPLEQRRKDFGWWEPSPAG